MARSEAYRSLCLFERIKVPPSFAALEVLLPRRDVAGIIGFRIEVKQEFIPTEATRRK